jgi:hypothetical protein
MSPEHWLNHFVSAHPVIAIPADYAYATWHYLVTLGVVVWLWRRHPVAYLRGRRVLVAATLLALIVFWLVPMAPPRLLPGFVDTMGQYSGYGWWGEEASAPSGLGSLTNQLAAMPSLHVGWSVWCGVQLVQNAHRRLVRLAGLVYPSLTVLVVIGTGNHYLADAVAGVAVLLLGYGVAASFMCIATPTRRLHGSLRGIFTSHPLVRDRETV